MSTSNGPFLGAAALIALCASPSSAAPPTFDSAAACAHEADKTSCANMEKDAKATLAALWPTVPPAIREPCVAKGRAARGSYIVVLLCVRNPS